MVHHEAARLLHGKTLGVKRNTERMQPMQVRPMQKNEPFEFPGGFEPPIFCSVGRRVIHCATETGAIENTLDRSHRARRANTPPEFAHEAQTGAAYKAKTLTQPWPVYPTSNRKKSQKM